MLSPERQITDTSGGGQGETTVAMDFGRITISDDVVLYLFGTPGQQRFSFMWETLSEGMLGFVVLVDALSEDSIMEAVSMIEFFTGMSDVPFVVAANKDYPEDMSTRTSLRARLSLDESAALLPCDARDRESVKSVLLGLLYRILDSMS